MYGISVYEISVYDMSVYDISAHDIAVYGISVYDISVYDISVYEIAVYDISVYEPKITNPTISSVVQFDQFPEASWAGFWLLALPGLDSWLPSRCQGESREPPAKNYKPYSQFSCSI